MMFRFTIRELLMLTLVVAVAAAWWLDHRNLTAQIAGQKARLQGVFYFLAERGWQVRTWDNGGEVLEEGLVVQNLP